MIPHRFMARGVGFACGYIYVFGYMIDFANKAVTFSQYLSYWTRENETRNEVLAITFFFLVPILVNILTVRKYGELEFVVTAIKLYAILVLIIIAFVIAAGGAPSPRLGTDAAYRAVNCVDNDYQIAPCVLPPGIGCTRPRLRNC
jgi:amino acid permease